MDFDWKSLMTLCRLNGTRTHTLPTDVSYICICYGMPRKWNGIKMAINIIRDIRMFEAEINGETHTPISVRFIRKCSLDAHGQLARPSPAPLHRTPIILAALHSVSVG